MHAILSCLQCTCSPSTARLSRAALYRVQLHPRQVFVTHGEPAASDAFRRRLSETFGWSARVPDAGETVALS